MLSLVNINICVNVTAFVMYTQTEKKLGNQIKQLSAFLFSRKLFFCFDLVRDGYFLFFMGENCKCRGMMEESGMNTIRIKEIPLTIVSALSGPYMCNVYVPGAAPHTLFIAHESWTMATQK